jgi:thioredoxin reductase
MLDVIVVGGGPAGLSAALVLGRSGRSTLVLDAGKPRNAASRKAHTFLTRDGIPPSELLERARAELEQYPSVEVRLTEALSASVEPIGFEVTLANGGTESCRKLLLATGVVDELPPIDGLAQLWGTSVFHCPYCDGWENRGSALAVYDRGAEAMSFVPVVLGWSEDLVLCTDGPSGLSDRARDELEHNGVRIVETPIVRLEGSGRLERIVFSDGSAIAAQLACGLTDNGLVEVTPERETSVSGVYAAGDAASKFHQIVVAAAAGAEAAKLINRALANGDLAAGERAPISRPPSPRACTTYPSPTCSSG